MSNYLVDSSDLTSVANAIRTAGGTTAPLSFPSEFISAIQAIGGGGGGSGITEFETGTYTTNSNISRPTISFSDAHSVPPSIIVFADATGTSERTANTNYSFTLIDFYRIFGTGVPSGSTGVAGNTFVFYTGRDSSTSSTITGSMVCAQNSDNTGSSSTSYSRYFATPSNFKPYTGSNSRYWRSGRTYKWVAIWFTMPTS